MKVKENKPKILLFGGTGLLGSAIRGVYEIYYKSNYTLYSPGRNEFVIDDNASILRVIKKYSPDIIINCLVKVDVEKCEQDEHSAFNINNNFVEKLLNNTTKLHKTVHFIQISTSDIFNNNKTGKFIQIDEEPNPCNIYSKSKLVAEKTVISFVEKNPKLYYSIIRTGWIYGRHTKPNFLNKIISQLIKKQPIQAINDQFNIPVWNVDLAFGVFTTIQDKLYNKILHFSSNPVEIVSKYDIVKWICKVMKFDNKLITPVKRKDIFNVPRPHFSCLYPSKELPIPYWKDSIKEFVLGQGFSTNEITTYAR